MFEAATGTQVRELKGCNTAVSCLLFGATSDVLYSGGQGSDNAIAEWRLAEGREPTVMRTLQGHTHSVSSIALSPEERYMASASFDRTVRLWEVATGQPIRVLEGHITCVNSVVWSRDGEAIVSGSYDNTVSVWGMDAQVCIVCFRHA